MKVTKRVGKLTQWTSEKLGSNTKTELSEDFQILEQDVELRRQGVEKIYAASKDVSKHLAKKVEVEDAEGAKMTPTEALGSMWIAHGDEFAGDSAFGTALRAYGKAQLQIGTAKATYRDKFEGDWLSSLEKMIAQFGEYTNQRKKLDSRRLTYDAFLAKVQKSKKEKVELENELRLAKNRYEETSEEVQQRGVAIQDAETDQLAALSKLLEAEFVFVESYRQILEDLRREWVVPSAIKQARRKSTAHNFGAEPKPTIKSRSSIKGLKSSLSRSRTPESEPEDQEEEDDEEEPPRSKRTSMSTRSRSSTLSRKKSVSEDKSEKATPGSNRFGGIRIPGLSGSSGPKDYAVMDDDMPSSQVARRAIEPPPLRRSLTAPASPKHQRVVEAKWDYSTVEPDELNMLVGDHVVVTSEVNSEWMIGQSERTGESGMFPSAYVVAVAPIRSNHMPPTPPDDDDLRFLSPDKTGMSDVSDTFADPVSDDDESEGAMLRPNGRQAIAPATGAMKHMPSLPRLGAGTTGKRPPPPPPARRATMTGSKGSVCSNRSEEAPEAFGSVSELKKRLGMGR